ncbi:MAG: indole-3-glycerol phosphate synthase TrpC [Candidatus Diapherotrites archaeon]|nr:indole-3-glycerol phosphate synthase TrpC [Candidatus Diapherotrites archaeon]
MDLLDKFIAQAQENVKTGYYANCKTVQQVKFVSLKKVLEKQNFSLIAEIKHASPAGEYSFDYIDIPVTASLFKENGADAISVVVEPKIFNGNLEHISIAKKVGLPVVFKDFVVDKQQMQAAAQTGADVILLVAKILNRLNLPLDDFIKTAHDLGLEVLLECYDLNEFENALTTKADILGINNRNLETLQVDLNVTKIILEKISFKKINKPIISESGVRTRIDAEFLKACGVKGVLVGTALWKAVDQKEKIKELKLRDLNEN